MDESKRRVEPGNARADQILDVAKSEVDAWLSAAEEQVVHWIHEAEKRGKKKGVSQADQLKGKLKSLSTQIREEVQQEVVRTAVLVASKILNAEISENPEAVVSIAKSALSSIPDPSQVWLRANPADIKLLQAKKRELTDVLERVQDIDFKEDKQVEKGGVLIQTESGLIDTQPKTQIEELGRALGV